MVVWDGCYLPGVPSTGFWGDCIRIRVWMDAADTSSFRYFYDKKTTLFCFCLVVIPPPHRITTSKTAIETTIPEEAEKFIVFLALRHLVLQLGHPDGGA
ncbi:hypothetical protein CEXT_550751 [Caerostris extrusa]|uniref:Uncharacterized protein n=1 Tax=Caerostris extrusa TaxID=172846 RepID=A0AAV4TVH6_CAEEX|nr:hypothetical protein CEXT_550751 [Caerostris extrusa]